MRISDWSSDVCASDLLVSGVQYPATLAQGSAILPAFSAIKKTACSTVSIPAPLGGGRGMSDDPNPQQHRTRCVLDAVHAQSAVRTEERRVGKAFVSTCTHRWSLSH